MTNEHKRCTKCGEEKPATAEFFFRNALLKDGLRSSCKICTRKSVRQWKVDNRERVLEHKRRYNKKNHEKRSAYMRQWHTDNHERVKEYIRQWRLDNHEKLIVSGSHYRVKNAENRRRWRVSNRPMKRISTQRYRARKRNLPATFTTIEWQSALDYWNGCCAVCGRQLHDLFADRTAAQDHWIPQDYKGADNPGYVATNIVPLCHGTDGCNNSKGKTPAADWLTERYGKRKAREIMGRIEAYFEWVEEKAEAAFAASRPAPEHRGDMRESIA